MNNPDLPYHHAFERLSQEQFDFSEVRRLLTEAASAGHTAAAFELAKHLLDTNSPYQDREQGMDMLRIAAEQGHPYARYNLAYIQELEGAPPETLIPLYKPLAEAGLPEAQVRLMYLLYASRHFEEALKWAKTTAKNNNPHGQYLLAQYCQYGMPPDFETAHLLYRKAAAQGLAAAQWQLGLQYRFGQGTPTDTTQAINHLRAAAQQGYIPAYTPLAELILPTAPDEAVHWFQQAARENDHKAHAALADIYLQGKHLERNHELALHHAEAAAAERHPEGLRILGDIYRYGLGMASDKEKALHYYRQAAEAGSLSAYQKLISDSALNHPEQYGSIKDSAIRRQRAERLYQKAQALHYGLQCTPEYAAALKLYTEAAELGHSKAQTNLGSMYYFGQGMAADYGKARKWFEQAAAQKDSMALYNLACIHYNGHGVEPDNEKACLYLQEAINSGHEQKSFLQELLQQWQNAV
ncbi:tetratricopeptide repeat protein [Neisseria sp. SLRRB23]|uniref:tetratricopeptide repeat protein n=1 Tax=Neisseria sp. SLRRB23 TaxID=3435199 RepID=UPI003D7FBAE0